MLNRVYRFSLIAFNFITFYDRFFFFVSFFLFPTVSCWNKIKDIRSMDILLEMFQFPQKLNTCNAIMKFYHMNYVVRRQAIKMIKFIEKRFLLRFWFDSHSNFFLFIQSLLYIVTTEQSETEIKLNDDCRSFEMLYNRHMSLELRHNNDNDI